MFKRLSRFFLGDTNPSVEKVSNELINRVKAEFKDDYIDNKSFVGKFPLDIAQNIEESISDTYLSSNRPEDTITSTDPVFHIFGGLQSLYISLWLAETGYGKKLALKMKQLLYTDAYGDTCFDDWKKELNNFVSDRLYKLDSYLCSSIPEKYQAYAKQLNMDYQLNIKSNNSDDTTQDIVEEIAFKISFDVDQYYENMCNSHTTCTLDEIENPYDYEHAIANEFTSLGWVSNATSGSGDQGADVIAEKNGIKLIIQCKLYSSPVGNKAVQEVAAAHGYYEGDISAVITNNGFTKSAKQLAESLDVYLIHHSQIATLDELLFEEAMEDPDFIDEECE